jgi:hypothetical protein
MQESAVKGVHAPLAEWLAAPVKATVIKRHASSVARQ